MKSKPLLLSLLAFILVSCAGHPAATAITTPKTAASATFLPKPTSTPPYTYTSTSTATLEPWFTPFHDSSWIATIEAISTKVNSLTSDCQPDFTFNSSSSIFVPPISPDGNWVVKSCQLPSETRLEAMRLDGKKVWTISNTQILAALPILIDDYFIIPLDWTNDSQYFFFSLYSCCVDSGPPRFGTAWGPLFRLDIQTGYLSAVVMPASNNAIDLFTYSFSPTDRRLVYIENQFPNGPLPLKILDLKTGVIENVSLPDYYDAGEIIWSPDGLSFAFGAAHASQDGQAYTFSVYAYQITSKTLISIITFSPDMCRPTELSTDSLLTLSCLVFGSEQRATDHYIQYYDLNTDTLFSPSPTP